MFVFQDAVSCHTSLGKYFTHIPVFVANEYVSSLGMFLGLRLLKKGRKGKGEKRWEARGKG